ncbi:MAG: amidohydrolase family protein, partial [Elainellaceae cyanobacterium]
HDVPVGLGVDGSASNDTGNLLQEARTAFLMARVREGSASAMTAREILDIATLGGARVLGRDDIGAIAPGMAADFIAVNLERPQFAGALHDPVAAVVFCLTDRVDYSVINGNRVVDQGQLVPVDLPRLVKRTNQIASHLVLD